MVKLTFPTALSADLTSMKCLAFNLGTEFKLANYYPHGVLLNVSILLALYTVDSNFVDALCIRRYLQNLKWKLKKNLERNE